MIDMSEAAKECRREYLREWRAKNPDKVKAINARYYAKTHPAKEKKAKVCKYCTLDDDWYLPSRGRKDGLWAYMGIDKSVASVGINYKTDEIEHFDFPIRYCPYCGKKLKGEGES